MLLLEELRKLEREGRPLRLGCHGAGWMGGGLAAQIERTPGMEVAVLADPHPEAARQALEAAGVSAEAIVLCDTPEAAAEALATGQRVVTADPTLAAQLAAINAVVDATTSPAAGAAVAMAGIAGGKDVVLLNPETDATVGHVLRRRAAQAGVLYTVASGNPAGCLMALWEEVALLGLEPIAIGAAVLPLRLDATPDDMPGDDLSWPEPALAAAQADGTQLAFAMTSAANATGCVPMRRGLVGPEADLNTVTLVFMLREDGGISTRPGVVDFVQSRSMGGGVFITCRAPAGRARSDLRRLAVGNGKYATLYRPRCLWFVEAPISIAEACLWRKVTLAPVGWPTADAVAVAKRDLQPGDLLDGFGGYTFRAVVEPFEAAQSADALPAGLAPGAQMVEPVRKGDVIRRQQVTLDETSLLATLRREQDSYWE
ncbi:MAG: hypothetical protein NZ528_14740 [Caldilineales bacterium]|nr:hypothetical protein [Caldilineales bacterium]MDW8318549.1 hypothetical protein [Anaerolineae bacterium]